MSNVIEQAKKAKAASYKTAILGRAQKDEILAAMAKALVDNSADIIEANRIDVEKAEQEGATSQFIDRLSLNPSRIKDMAEGLLNICALDDPTSRTVSMWQRPNGLRIGKRRVPLGVIGIIYEARPNVTADAIGLCIKSGNACILRGGKEALNSNEKIVEVMLAAGGEKGLPDGAVQYISDTGREATLELMKLHGIVDVLIPRGGAGLIKSVVENAAVPVIETGIGNCHVYIDKHADFKMASEIIINAKCSRPSVCNAAETLIVHDDIAEQFLPVVCKALMNKGVEIRGCPRTKSIVPCVMEAVPEDWDTEYGALILAVKTVSSLEEAIEHINRHGTKHSEAIVTESYSAAEKFLNEIDAASVYVNASTRFTDGGEFGFGAEIGISTQKLHARGPLGLEELTTFKYVVYGTGQVR